MPVFWAKPLPKIDRAPGGMICCSLEVGAHAFEDGMAEQNVLMNFEAQNGLEQRLALRSMISVVKQKRGFEFKQL